MVRVREPKSRRSYPVKELKTKYAKEFLEIFGTLEIYANIDDQYAEATILPFEKALESQMAYDKTMLTKIDYIPLCALENWETDLTDVFILADAVDKLCPNLKEYDPYAVLVCLITKHKYKVSELRDFFQDLVERHDYNPFFWLNNASEMLRVELPGNLSKILSLEELVRFVAHFDTGYLFKLAKLEVGSEEIYNKIPELVENIIELGVKSRGFSDDLVRQMVYDLVPLDIGEGEYNLDTRSWTNHRLRLISAANEAGIAVEFTHAYDEATMNFYDAIYYDLATRIQEYTNCKWNIRSLVATGIFVDTIVQVYNVDFFISKMDKPEEALAAVYAIDAFARGLREVLRDKRRAYRLLDALGLEGSEDPRTMSYHEIATDIFNMMNAFIAGFDRFGTVLTNHPEAIIIGLTEGRSIEEAYARFVAGYL